MYFRLSQDRLTGLLKWYKTDGLVPKYKKSGGRLSTLAKQALSFDDIKRTVSFIICYADDHARVLPGRVPGFKHDDIKLLPSSHTKVVVYGQYKKSLEGTDFRVVGESSFRSLWNQLTPYIVTAKPMTDLCWTCQRNNTLIYRYFQPKIAIPFATSLAIELAIIKFSVKLVQLIFISLTQNLILIF
jgi:hypothetical protein